jgi:hypothetical protein
MSVFEVETVETVTRSYKVTAKDEKQARARLHLFWRDPETVREGIVTRTEREEINNRQVKQVTGWNPAREAKAEKEATG